MAMSCNISFHRVKNLSSHTYTDLESVPFYLSLEGEDGRGSDIVIHTYNAELALALVEAINGAVAAVKAKQAVPEAA